MIAYCLCKHSLILIKKTFEKYCFEINCKVQCIDTESIHLATDTMNIIIPCVVLMLLNLRTVGLGTPIPDSHFCDFLMKVYKMRMTSEMRIVTMERLAEYLWLPISHCTCSTTDCAAQRPYENLITHTQISPVST